MKTKFIGLEGFDEIENISKNSSKKSKQLTTAQKAVRFVKRAKALYVKNSKTKSVKVRKAVRQPSVLDRQYIQNRRSAENSNAAMESLSYLRNKPMGKTYKHSAPETRNRVIKKKAVLAVVASLTAIMLSCITVASALDAPQTQAEPPKAPLAAAIATADEAKFDLESPSVYVANNLASLYVDGELIGTTDEPMELDALLEQKLVDARAKYDDTTTTEYVSDVKVERHGADNGDALSAAELMEQAADKLSIKLETDWSYDMEIDYDTDVTYDEDEDSDYEKVVTEGEKGVEQVNVRLTYIDGAFYNADVISTEVTKYPVTEDVVKGSKQGKRDYSSPAGESSGSFIWPFPHTHNITSLFEWRWGRMHQGIDIAGGDDYGQAIVAADGGKVTWSGNDGGGYGNYVMIDHGNGYMTVYGHASALACETGDEVSQGDVIAYCGSTGNSTGPHVHFEIRVDGVQVDPLGFVS